MKTSHVAGLVVALSCGSASAQTVTRGPYLQQVTSNQAVIVWRTDEATTSVVRLGTDAAHLDQIVSLAGTRTQHEVRVSGLLPGTTTFYSVGTATGALAGGDALHFVRTAPPVGLAAPFRMWVVGDSGTGGSRQAQVRDAMLKSLGNAPLDMFLHVGDMAYDTGTDAEFQQRFFDMYAPILRNTSCWPAMGNHEGITSDAASQTGPYYDAYVLPTAAQAGGLPSGTEAYYSFDYANVHFVVLDSQASDRSVGGAMLTWLMQDLAATSQDWIIAYWHHPPYSKGSHDSDTDWRMTDMRQNALPILEAAGVDLVITGHSHIYERSYLLHGAYDTPTVNAAAIVDGGDGHPSGDGAYASVGDGAVYVVAGHGGTGVSGMASPHPMMMVTEVAHGSCLIEMDGDWLLFRNIRWDGEETDEFAMIKGDGLSITYPRGHSFIAGMTLAIRWVSAGAGARVAIDASYDGGSSWSSVIADTENDGYHPWVIPPRPPGSVKLRLTDLGNGALTATSELVVVSELEHELVPWQGEWRYSDQNVDEGTAWVEPSFDDGAWSIGFGQLGYGDGDEATVLRDDDPNIPTVYFRHRFESPGEITAAHLRVLFDDGVAVWVNGALVLTHNMANGTSHEVYASADSPDDHVEVVSVPMSPSPFVVGTNVITAMVKQASGSSSDLSFDLSLVATIIPVMGAGGTGGASGVGGSGGVSGSGGAGAAGSGGSSGPRSGCDCAATSNDSIAWLGLAMLLLVKNRRRRAAAS